MLKSLRVQNFKPWQDTGLLRCAPITALFGANGTGKTSLLQFLLMLKQTADAADLSQVLNLGGERDLVDLGTAGEVIHNHKVGSTLEWNLEWTLPEPLQINDPGSRGKKLFRVKDLGLASSIQWDGNGEAGGLVVNRFAYQFCGQDFGMQREKERGREFGLVEPGAGFRFVETRCRKWPLPPPVKCYGFPDQVRAYFQNAGFLSILELEFELFCDRIYYLGPLREYPKRQYAWAGAYPADMGPRGERVVDALLASRESGDLISRGRGRKRESLEETVARWLKNLGLVASFEVRAITPGGRLFEVWVRRHARAAEVLLTDAGFGVSQILPVIALCYSVPNGSILLLEQPEIHLHPAVQSGLADVVIDAVLTRNVQVILESHSEHFLRRLQRRIAEEKIPSRKCRLYFCESRNGSSQVKELDLDLFGVISNWPRAFFGDEFEEIAATQTARLRRDTSVAR